MTAILITRQTLNQFTVTYPEGTDLTGKSARLEIRNYDRIVQLSLTDDAGLEIQGRTITATITTDQSQTLKAGSYKADLALIEAGEVTRTPSFNVEVVDYITDAD